MPNLYRIPEAIADLESQKVPNIKATAEKYGIERMTLGKRQKGKTSSMEECISIHRQALTNSQEKALVRLINRLIDRNMPPTTTIVKNLAKEIRGYAIGKNQIASFIRRYENELKSLYLKSINNKRIKSEFPPIYKLFYRLVKCYFLLLY